MPTRVGALSFGGLPGANRVNQLASKRFECLQLDALLSLTVLDTCLQQVVEQRLLEVGAGGVVLARLLASGLGFLDLFGVRPTGERQRPVG